MSRRTKIMVGAICLAAIGAALGLGRDAEPVARPDHAAELDATRDPTRAATRLMAQAEAALPAAVDPAARNMSATTTVDLFAAKSWYVAPPAPPAPKPVAPPFPYTLAGSMREGTATIVFLARGERNYVLHQGDVIDGSYRLDEIKNDVAVFSYLPLNEKQSLPIGNDK